MELVTTTTAAAASTGVLISVKAYIGIFMIVYRIEAVTINEIGYTGIMLRISIGYNNCMIVMRRGKLTEVGLSKIGDVQIHFRNIFGHCGDGFTLIRN